jgi:hypothetical protein
MFCGQGVPRVYATRQVQIIEKTFYRWRKQYGGMGTDQLKELKRLKKENEQLRRAISDQESDKLILSEAEKGNFSAPRVVEPVLTICEIGSASQNVGLVASWGSTDQRRGGCQLGVLTRIISWPI